MKTDNQNQRSGLQNRTEQLRTGLGNRINLARRVQNRSLNTESLLNLLHREAPKFFSLAEIVGKWVWIAFDHKQPRTVTSRLSELGFHWNRNRQAWQHPCGVFRDRAATYDPREHYGCRSASTYKVA